MAKVALNTLSLKELVELQSDVATAIVERKAADKTALQQKMAEMAAASGFTLGELLDGGKAKRGARAGSGGTAPVKYRNPENPSETWSGRGRMATWLKERIGKRGVKAEDFLV
jgi:DNA-binding protein H-NS